MAAVVYDVIPTLPVVKAHLVVDCVLVFLTWVVVALRVMARRISGVGLGWDDYLILAALVSFPPPLPPSLSLSLLPGPAYLTYSYNVIY